MLLDTSGAVNSFRIPPIHEWTDDDLERARQWIARMDALVMQPVRDRYRGLDCGTSQLEAFLPSHGRLVVVPVLRYDGLMPYQAIIRSPSQPSLNPPVVPYHDLRILAAAARGQDQIREVHPSVEKLRHLAGMSVAQLRRREEAFGTVVMSDHLETAPVWHTINHPDNTTLMEFASRVLRILRPDARVADPGRELLGGPDAPIDDAAAQALGVTVEGRSQWSPPAPDLESQQLAFYRAHPDVVEAGLSRHAERLHILELL